MLELCSISKTLGQFSVSNLSAEISDGEYFVLLGPSGAGKSVLVDIIAGLMKPDKGRVLWNGRDVTCEKPESRGFAVVYQDYALFPHLTVRHNIIYGPKAVGISLKERDTRLTSLAEMLGIEHLLSRRPETLSGGEQQRVALARALIIQPKLLLLDEPLSALDINTRLKLRKDLKRISQQLNISVLHVTHDTEEAMVLADRIGVMLQGTIRQSESPIDLFRRPSDPEIAAFLGMKNILPITRYQEGICLVCRKHIYASSANRSSAYMWIKPEEIVISKNAFDSSARNQFKCKVMEIERLNSVLSVRLVSDELPLTALITYESFSALQIQVGAEAYATFKSSAVHCF